VAEFVLNDSQIPLSGPNSILGRAVVVHELEDDLGLGNYSEPGVQGKKLKEEKKRAKEELEYLLHKTSKTTGNAGGRIGCGIIGRAPAS